MTRSVSASQTVATGLRRLPGGPDLSGPVLAATGLFLAGLICLPIGWLVAFAFSNRSGSPTLANFAALLDDPTLSEPLVTTLGLSVLVAFFASIAAAPIAWLVARTDLPGKRTVRLLMMASLVTPPFLGAIAWEILAAPNSGIINRLWRDLTGTSDALFDIYSFPGLVFVVSCYAASYVFVVLTDALDRIPADLEDAAGIFGAGRWKVVTSVTLPLVLPALLAGALVAFLQAMTGPIPMSARRMSPNGIFTRLKKGGPTVIFTPRTASERIGKSVPQSTENAMPTNARLLKRNAASRLAIDSSCASGSSRGQRA